MATQISHYPNHLRMLIRSAGYSFREVSRETSIPESILYDWAAGKRPVPHRERQILARLLGCDERDLQPAHDGNGFYESIAHPPAIDLGVTEKLDSAESIINLAWEAWFASRPGVASRSVNKLLPGLEKLASAPYLLSGQTLRAKELASRAHGV
jgi:hypothetical protein